MLNYQPSLGYFFAQGAIYAVMLLLPLTIGVAILRYQLFDIDVLINRALVYGLLTGILALVYFGCIVSLQTLARAVIGHESSLEIVASTLAIIVLFQPLRRRIQWQIDRAFYRSKVDAAKILTAFSTALLNEVDLSEITAQLLSVVAETMQPAHMSLWLRKSRVASAGDEANNAPTGQDQ